MFTAPCPVPKQRSACLPSSCAAPPASAASHNKMAGKLLRLLLLTSVAAAPVAIAADAAPPPPPAADAVAITATTTTGSGNPLAELLTQTHKYCVSNLHTDKWKDKPGYAMGTPSMKKQFEDPASTFCSNDDWRSSIARRGYGLGNTSRYSSLFASDPCEADNLYSCVGLVPPLIPLSSVTTRVAR